MFIIFCSEFSILFTNPAVSFLNFSAMISVKFFAFGTIISKISRLSSIIETIVSTLNVSGSAVAAAQRKAKIKRIGAMRSCLVVELL